MSQKQKRDGSYIWVTWLKGLMVGDQSCEWASWFKSNYQNYEKVPSDFDSVAWNMNHTRLLRELHQVRRQAGDQISLERQNRFTYRHPSGVVLGGMPDLVSISTSNESATVYDAKTGQERDADRVQVMIYMHLLPLAHPAFEGMQLDGMVVYQDSQFYIPASAIDNKFIEGLTSWIDVLSSKTPALKVPSLSECRFCEVSKSECPERIANNR